MAACLKTAWLATIFRAATVPTSSGAGAVAGKPVRDAHAWLTGRRPEIIRLYETEIFGRIPATAPRVTWRVTDTEPHARDGAAVLKRIAGKIGDAPDAPQINVKLYTPANARHPVPVILLVNFGGRAAATPGPSGTLPLGDPPVASAVIARGWGYATVGYQDIQPDRAEAWTEGVIGVTRASKREKPAQDEWGTISAWAWGVSRLVDYGTTLRGPAISDFQ